MIRTHLLTRDFVVSRTQTVQAVRGISLDIGPGELVALLGPNGAGKTTTMRMLTTLITPTSGTATVAGHDVVGAPAAVRRHIGYVGQGNGAGHHQRVGDELYAQGVMYGLDRRAAMRRADELIEAFDLTELRRRKVGDLSGGQRRRLDVAMGLVHRPRLLFLDEPTTGLDPQNRANLWEHILRMRREYAMTVLLTTHYLDEADSMAERVVVVDHGEVIADDTADALKTKLAGDRIVVTVATDAATDAATDGAIAPRRLAELAAQLPGARDVTVDAQRVEVRVADGPAALPELQIAAHECGLRIATVQLHRPTLDDVFLNLTGRSLREAGAIATDTQTIRKDPA
ncbi:ATP-binding cassette domain-containing protein [Micromonospora sp. NPDC003197]